MALAQVSQLVYTEGRHWQVTASMVRSSQPPKPVVMEASMHVPVE